MKQTNSKLLTSEELITILNDKLTEFPTKKDVESIVKREIKEQLKNHPTKKDLHIEIECSDVRTDLKIDQAKREIDDKAREYRDQILTRMDKDVGEQAQIREDNEFRDHDVRELKQTSEDHENRISKLEQSPLHKN